MKERFSEAMNEIKEEYLEEAMAPGKRQPVYRWIALAASLALVVSLGVAFSMRSGDPGTEASSDPQLYSKLEMSVVLPPNRLGEAQSSGAIATEYTVQSAYEKAAAVAWVRIGNWIGEDIEELSVGTTYFEAEVLEAFKGDLPDKILIKQDGSSLRTIMNYPLFTYGEEMLLFLAASTEGSYIENCYWILGGHTTALDVAEDKNGDAYVVDTCYFLKKSMENTPVTNVQDQEERREIFACLENRDPLLDGADHPDDWVVLKLEDFRKLLG